MITLAAEHEHEEVIKRSRFLARAASIADEAEALRWMASVREREANHNCWAWRLGDVVRFSDDGEPGGTAGRPILSAIEMHGLDGVAVVVTRWFGGIKLGAGGLVRAYRGVAASCLREAPKREVRRYDRLDVAIPYAETGNVYPTLDRLGVDRLDERYGDGVVLAVRVDAADTERVVAALRDATRGAAAITVTGSEDR